MFQEDNDSKKIFHTLQIIFAILILIALTWYIFQTVHFFQTNKKATKNVTNIFKMQNKK
ncbi:MAG TPA: hypothetical protein VLG12_06030 [Candidatus Saccharimonadales bacterium]|nr:hypothetical protein [Candidatus Saccharimonadales bacterium]